MLKELFQTFLPGKNMVVNITKSALHCPDKKCQKMTTGHFKVSKFHTWNGLRKTSGIPLANMMSHMYKM